MIGIVVVVGGFFLLMGLYGLLAPAALVRPFGLVVDQPKSRSEVRAVYGGFGLAMAVALGVALTVPTLEDGIVLAVAFALGGMAFGRLVSRLVDRATAFYPIWFYFLIEALAAGLLALVALG